MIGAIPRPCLTAALAHLAELRAERQRRAGDRLRVLTSDAEDRAGWIRQAPIQRGRL